MAGCPIAEPHHWYDIGFHVKHACVIMVATTGGWFQSLPEFWRNIIAVGAILGMGFGIGLTVSNLYGLPHQVESLENRMSVAESSIEMNRAEISENQNLTLYIARLSEWMTCAISAHNETSSVLASCGPEPHRLGTMQ